MTGAGAPAAATPAAIAVVAIGRNEGDRLKACLRSLPADAVCVYVDSGSSDDSVAFARGMGIDVVELARGTPFTAALARNAGMAAVRARAPDIGFVQMVDGDCEIDPAWIGRAAAALTAEPDLAVVFGRRRERYPARSVYNRLCDHEWDVPVGEARSCGGDALFRTAALAAVDGYEPTLIAGEEPDLCLRLRTRGWRVRRIDAEMTRHDAAMTRFGQWWRRMERGGHAFAELAWRHGAAADPHWRGQVRSMIAWGLALPLAIVVAGAVAGWPWAAALALLFPLQVLRIAWRMRQQGEDSRFALALGWFLVLGKFPQVFGAARFHLRRLAGKRSTLIEYKTAAS